MDTSLLIAAGASFVAGLVGTIIAKLWIKPIARHKKIRRKLESALIDCLERMESTAAGPDPLKKGKQAQATLRSARKHAMDLVSCHQGEIPYWYRLFLESRQVAPNEALGLLTNLDKIPDLQQVQKRVRSAREAISGVPKKSDEGEAP
jgi:hypothetical protein